MSPRTSTLLIAAALTAAAFTLGAQAADRDTGGQSTQSADEKSAAAEPARTLDRNWWEEERALDDGYTWPLPSASRMR